MHTVSLQLSKKNVNYKVVYSTNFVTLTNLAANQSNQLYADSYIVMHFKLYECTFNYSKTFTLYKWNAYLCYMYFNLHRNKHNNYTTIYNTNSDFNNLIMMTHITN